MAEKKAFHRSWIFYILSGILLIMVVAGFFIWRNYKYKLVNKKLGQLVTVKSKGLYQINYQHLVIDEALGNISAENVDMIPDTIVYKRMVKEKTSPAYLFTIHIPRLLITGVRTPKALLNKEISAHIIRFENAKIEIRLSESDKKRNSDYPENTDKELYRQILGDLKSITSDSVVLESSDLTILKSNAENFLCKVSGLDIRLSGIAIDSLNHADSNRIAFSKDLAVHCKQVEMPDKNRKYSLQLYGIDFSSLTGNLHLNQIKYKQHLSEDAFARSNKFADDRFDIEMGKLDIWNINRQAILKKNLVADSVQFTGALIRIFRDKSYPHDTIDRTHSYPQEAIMLLPFRIYIKKMLFRDSYLEYKEKNKLSDSSGKVGFFHIQATIDNVTNMRAYIIKNNKMRLNFNSSFLNQTPLRAVLAMVLDNRNGNFQLDAKMGPLDAVALNPLLRPMALAELERGKIKGLHYILHANNKKGKGKLIILYDDLAIKLLKKDEDKNRYKTKLFPTLAAGFFLKDSNPKNGNTRIGNVDYTRDIHRSMFNMMWKSLFEGIKQVAL